MRFVWETGYFSKLETKEHCFKEITYGSPSQLYLFSRYIFLFLYETFLQLTKFKKILDKIFFVFEEYSFMIVHTLIQCVMEGNEKKRA